VREVGQETPERGLGGDRLAVRVAELGRDGNELFELLAAADAALYRAKHSGRDRVATLPLGACPSDPRHRCP